MKKLLAVLLALCIVGGAFAQVTFSGYERAVTTYTQAAGLTIANRLRLNLSVTDKDGNFGAWGRLQNADSAAPTISYMYGWVQLGKMIKLTGGVLGNYDYDLSSGSASDYAATGNVSNDMVILDNQKGLLLQVTPVDALSIGVSIIPQATIGLGNFGLNAKYDIKDVGSVVATSWLNNTAANSAFSLSFDLTSVKSLDISAGFKYGSTIGYKATAAKNMDAYAIVNFDGGAFTAQLAPEFDITASKLYIEGYAQYVMDAFTFRGIVAYDQTAAQVGATTYFAGEAAYAVTKTAAINMGVYYDTAVTVKADVKVKF